MNLLRFVPILNKIATEDRSNPILNLRGGLYSKGASIVQIDCLGEASNRRGPLFEGRPLIGEIRYVDIDV